MTSGRVLRAAGAGFVAMGRLIFWLKELAT